MFDTSCTCRMFLASFGGLSTVLNTSMKCSLSTSSKACGIQHSSHIRITFPIISAKLRPMLLFLVFLHPIFTDKLSTTHITPVHLACMSSHVTLQIVQTAHWIVTYSASVFLLNLFGMKWRPIQKGWIAGKGIYWSSIFISSKDWIWKGKNNKSSASACVFPVLINMTGFVLE